MQQSTSLSQEETDLITNIVKQWSVSPSVVLHYKMPSGENPILFAMSDYVFNTTRDILQHCFYAGKQIFLINLTNYDAVPYADKFTWMSIHKGNNFELFTLTPTGALWRD